METKRFPLRRRNLLRGGLMLGASWMLFSSIDRSLGATLGFVVFYAAIMLAFCGGSMMRTGHLFPPEVPAPKVDIVQSPNKSDGRVEEVK